MGRTGRHNDKGIALTLSLKEDIDRLIDGIKKIHKIVVQDIGDINKLIEEVKECIKENSEWERD